MIYAYAICEPAAAAPQPPRGLGGATVRAVRREGLAAVYSRHRSLRPSPSRDALLTHERVVETVMARGPVLPLRFGTQLEGEDGLVAVLDARRDELLRALERVRGRVELGVRVIAAAPGLGAHRPAGEGSGRAYLLARVDAHRRAERAARDLHAPLAELAHAGRLRGEGGWPTVLAAAYLVDRGGVERFRARVAELAARHDDLRAVVTGPWPPYSFVDEEPAA